GLNQISSTPPTVVIVARIVPLLPSITYSMGGNETPSWPAQPTRKLLPGPWATLVGMQFETGKLLTTIGPLGLPILGSISSMVPMVGLGVALALVTKK